MKKQKVLIISEENFEKPHFSPLISALGVKINVNNVNIRKTPLYFQSRRDFPDNLMCGEQQAVKMQEQLRRGPGMSKLTNSLVNKSQRIHSIVNLGSFMI